MELIVPVLLTPEVAYRIFLATESTELNLFMHVLKAPVTIANNIHIYDLNYLCNYGYFGVDDNNIIIIPDDVASLFNEIYTTKFKKEHKIYSYILQYINATVNLYGIVSPQKIVEIYNLQNENKIDDNLFFRLLLISVSREQYFELFAGYIVHESLLMENDEMVALIHRQGDKPFYIPEKEQLLKYADDLYIDETPEYEALRKGIREELKLSAELTEQLCEDILLDCQMEEKLQSMINQFERRDISFRNTKQADKIIALIINLYNNARIWSNRGHTPNTPIILQIAHCGRQTLSKITGLPTVAPSPIRDKLYDEDLPHQLSETEINEIINSFVLSIERAKKAGFDGIQLHLAHGYLLSSFLSPHMNKRKDKWGGSTENRFRIVSEIMDKQ